MAELDEPGDEPNFNFFLTIEIDSLFKREAKITIFFAVE